VAVADHNDKRRMILDAATTVFSKRGFHASTIDMIAETAGIGKGTVYLYFSCKERILAELVYSAMDSQLQEADRARSLPDPAERLQGILSAGKLFLRRNTDMVRVIITQSTRIGRSPEFQERMRELDRQYLAMVVEAVKTGQDAGRFSTELPADVIGRLLCSLRMGMMVELAHSETMDVPDCLIRDAMHFILNGIGRKNTPGLEPPGGTQKAPD